MTLDEFILKYETWLQSQLFSGYFFEDRDPAARYRKMQAESAVLKGKLQKIYNDLFPPPRQADDKVIPKQVVNGVPRQEIRK